MSRVHITPRGVTIPAGPILAALDDAFKAARESGADNRDPESPGGIRVTPAEIREDLEVFFATWLEVALPGVVAANLKG